MLITVNYLNVNVSINTDNEKIVIKDSTNSDELFNMIFKSIMKKINIDTNNYNIIRKTN